MVVHSLAVKDMSGLLTPRAVTTLVSVLMEELPNMPLHMTLPGSCIPPRLW